MKDNGKKLLNDEQLKAVQHGEGPLLIIAGAGTGKTTVITERIQWLITEKKAKPAEILALTFTEKASREMEERVDRVLPYGYTQMWISTFHSFGERILRQEAMHIGLDAGYRILSGAESVIFFRKNLFAFSLDYFRPLGNPTKFIEGMLQHFSRLKDEDISPNQYLDWVKNQESRIKNQEEEAIIEHNKYQELANAYQKYEELKAKNGLMDFGDLIMNTLTLFRKRKNILQQYRSQYKYILIDEFQDTNFAQNELAMLLAGDKKNITVVGDDDQAIYRWRGAAISNIIQFRTHFPDAAVIVLTQNYRSTQAILDASYQLIQNNNPDRLEAKEHIEKRLISQRKSRGAKPTLLYCDRVENEAEEVVKEIKKLQGKISAKGGPASGWKSNGEELYQWKDFAILVRANQHADPFVRELSRAGIPYQFLGPGQLFRQPEVTDLIAYLRMLNDPYDSVAAFRVFSQDVFGIAARDIPALTGFARRTGISLLEAAEVVTASYTNDEAHWSLQKNYKSYQPFLSEESKEKIAKLVHMIHRHMALAKKETAGQILYFFLSDSGILDAITQFKTAKEEKVAANISKFFDRLKTYEIEHTDASIAVVVDWIQMSMDLGESPLAANMDWTENNAVNILTVHAAKGLEFPVVFLVNLVSQRFPTTERRERIPIPDELIKEILPEGDYHEQEERRVFYVGMTRAKDTLVFTAAKYYGEGKRERKLSPFVIEVLGPDAASKQEIVGAATQLSLLEWKKQENELPAAPVPRQPVSYLSYSQIDTFLTCPLQYKYRYILRIPVPASAAASFGTSIHAALQKFYEIVTKPAFAKASAGKEDLLKLLDDVWVPVGYGTKAYEEKMKERGRTMLSNFYEKAYNPAEMPRSLEQVFKIKLSPSLVVGGKIDRVDNTDGKLEIIDYKTGKRPTQKEIDQNLQMTVYALAATDPGIYGKKPEDVILSFYFFDIQEKVSSTRTTEQLAAARQQLVATAEKIATSDYKPTPGPWCDFCDFRLICEAWK